MALKILKETDPLEVKQLGICVYSPPGLGKSSLGFTCEAPLLIDFDNGSYRALNRKDVVQASSWADVAAMSADDLKPYKTLVIDTAGRALDALSALITQENPKMGNGGSLSLQGYGELKKRFTGWTKLIRSFGLDVVMIVHSDEQRKGDDIIERLDVQGASKNEIYKTADLMGRISLLNGKRILNFNPTDTAFGKNPGRLPALEIPDADRDPKAFSTCLATVIADTKSALNRQTEEQKAVAGMLVDWQARIDEAATADEFNGLIPETQKADERVRDNVKLMLIGSAKKREMEYDKESGAFKAKTPKPEAQEEQPKAGKPSTKKPKETPAAGAAA